MTKKIAIAIFAAILLLFPIATFIFMPKGAKPFSPEENRTLNPFPTVSVSTEDKLLGIIPRIPNIENKKFMTGFESWFSDRFFGRIDLIRIKNSLDKLEGQTETNNVFTVGEREIEKWTETPERDEKTQFTLTAIQKFAESHPAVPMFFLLAPTAQEIYKTQLPPNAGAGNQQGYIEQCYEKVPAVTGINTLKLLADSKDDYIYYRTDHHWTAKGAYLAYTAAAEKMKFQAEKLNEFSQIEHATNDFRGTLYSKTLDLSIPPDTIDFYHTDKDADTPSVVRWSDGYEEQEHDGLYFREFLETKDKYSVLLGEMRGITDVHTELAEKKSLLVFGDSYVRTLVPFLTRHYSDIRVIDLRYIPWNNSLATAEEYDKVLFCYNVSGFSDDTDLKRIGR